MDFSQLMAMHGGAALSGLGQGLMDQKFARAFNSGAGGYQDLYRMKVYPDRLRHEMARPGINKLRREAGLLLSNPETESMERGVVKPGAFRQPEGGY